MGWVTYVLDFAILCIIAAAGLGFAFYKQHQYQKIAAVSIQGIVRKVTGHKLVYVKECSPTARSIELGGATYFLNPENKKWGRYPPVPIFGIKSLQVPIREEIWDENNPVPSYSQEDGQPIKSPELQTNPNEWIPTAVEVQAEINQIQAVETSIAIQEQKDMFENSMKAIANQPNKMVVYIFLTFLAILMITANVIIAQGFGVI